MRGETDMTEARGPPSDAGRTDRRGARGRRRRARPAGDRLGRRRARRASNAVRARRTRGPRPAAPAAPGAARAPGRVGWISEGGLNYVCQRLTVPPAEAYGVASFYAMFSRAAPADRRARMRRHRVPRAGAEELCAGSRSRRAEDADRRMGPPPGCAGRAWGCASGPRRCWAADREAGRRLAGATVDDVRRDRSRGLARSPRRRRHGAADVGRGDARRAPAAPPRRRGGPVVARRLPRPRRLRGAPPRASSSAPRP